MNAVPGKDNGLENQPSSDHKSKKYKSVDGESLGTEVFDLGR